MSPEKDWGIVPDATVDEQFRRDLEAIREAERAVDLTARCGCQIPEEWA